MEMIFDVRYGEGPAAVQHMDTGALRSHFLIDSLFEENKIRLTYSHFDRLIVGGSMPVQEALTLQTIDPLKAEFFLERREIGIINVGGEGQVIADGEAITLHFKDALYIGRGTREVSFQSSDPNIPAKFYFNSAPAHRSCAWKKVTRKEAETVELGSLETANHRVIHKLLVNSVVDTCQLQMGMTELKPGSVWNTMPAHVHDRRMEAYFYFEIPEDQSVCHFMGPPQETRHIWVQNEQAVISPPWSIHAGAGTSNYTFIWGMAGENLDYDDMDKWAISTLR
jgi:4-deoxy-L-threo-5-hexosulose-uronate ketol-isomerase